MLTIFEIILYSYLSVHITISTLKYFKHHNFSLFEYLLGVDKVYKTILVAASVVSVIGFSIICRAYESNVMYDVAGNSYNLRENKFYIYDGHCEYTIKSDTIYLGDIKIGYFKYKDTERILHTASNEMKMFPTKPKNTHGKENIPIYTNVFISNAKMIYKLRTNNKLKAIKIIEKENLKKSELAWNVVNYRDSMIKIYNGRIDSINKRIDNNQQAINLLEKQYSNSK